MSLLIDLSKIVTSSSCESIFLAIIREFPNIEPNEYQSELERLDKILAFVDEIFYPLDFKCRVLSVYVVFVLLKIGFSVWDILIVDDNIYIEKHISYYEMKLLGYSRKQIHAIFYLINYKQINAIFKQEITLNSLKLEKNDIKDCVICLETFDMNNKVINLQCNHFFHASCIKKWLKIQFTCPTCRSEYSCYPEMIQNWILENPNDILYLDIIKNRCKGDIDLVK